jgi:nucleotide-binding universal stress UspA family protein
MWPLAIGLGLAFNFQEDLAMPFRTILLVTGVDHDAEDLIAAAELAQRSGAHLNAMVLSYAQTPVVDVVGQSYSAYTILWEEENARVANRVAELRTRLAARQLDANVQPVFCLTDVVDDEVAKRASYADVTLIGRAMLDDGPVLKRVLDGALFASPTPVMLAGPNGNCTLTPRTVLVAWNATTESGAAVRHAMDLLIKAENVHLVLVDPTARAYAMGEEPGADVAAFLARHGIKVTVETLASGGDDPALVLQRHATDIGAELVVMGAYGHSRLRERLFGGTTHTMLSHVGTPVLMGR